MRGCEIRGDTKQKANRYNERGLRGTYIYVARILGLSPWAHGRRWKLWLSIHGEWVCKIIERNHGNEPKNIECILSHENIL